MLHQFLTANAPLIVARASAMSHRRRGDLADDATTVVGVSIFLAQLAETLRLKDAVSPFSPTAIGTEAAAYGRELLGRRFTVSQVVHAYGDVCQAVTELAGAAQSPVSVGEFQVMNGCLDMAIAGAVTSFAAATSEQVEAEETRRIGHVAHEQRNLVHTALLALEALSLGAVAMNGSTGQVLRRSLVALGELIETTLTDVRLDAGTAHPVRLVVADFLDDVAVTAHLHAESSGVDLHVEPMARDAAVIADPQVLTSAVMNLLSNGFKFTPRGGRVVLRGISRNGRVQLDVEDQCGGTLDVSGDPFTAFRERRGHDRSGLGLGLSIARKAVRASGGEIHVRNLPGVGCVFTVDLPAAGSLDDEAAPPADQQ